MIARIFLRAVWFEVLEKTILLLEFMQYMLSLIPT